MVPLASHASPAASPPLQGEGWVGMVVLAPMAGTIAPPVGGPMWERRKPRCSPHHKPITRPTPRRTRASASSSVAPIQCNRSNPGCDLAKKTCDRANRICTRPNRICERSNQTCSRANEQCNAAPAIWNAAPKTCATGPRKLRPSKENLRRSKSDVRARTEKVQRRTETLRRFKSTVREANTEAVGKFQKQKSRITAAQACMRKGREG